jgi:hypothetical protein
VADTIYEHYTTEFSGNWIPRAQQTQSRLSNFVDFENGTFRGERKRFDRSAKQTFRRKNERKAPTVPSNPTLDFRWISRATYDIANDLDEDDADSLGELILPTGRWTRDHVSAYHRLCDGVYCAAALGSVTTGEDGDTTTAFSSSYQIAAGGNGLTLAKLRTANQLLMESDLEGAEIMGDGNGSPATRVIVVTAEQIDNLLGDTQITSSDYNTVKALANGYVDTFMGFKFIRFEGLTKASTTRSCVAWVKGAVVASKGPISTKIDVIPTESHKVQVRSVCKVGAMRLHDEAVIQIDCTETA